MERKTVVDQLELLAKLLREDGWGEHYSLACETAVGMLREEAAE